MAEFGSMVPAPMPEAPQEIDPRLLQQLIPMWLQSAGQTMPQSAPPMNTGVENYSSRDPAELAALRTANSVRPIAGRAGEGPSVRDVFNAMPMGALANTLSAATPAITTAIDLPAAAASQIGRDETGYGAPKNKQQQNESNVSARVGAAAAGADDRKSIMAEQKILSARGLYTGTIDGNAGPDTLAARAEAARLDAEAATKAAADSKTADAATATAASNAKTAEAALEKARLDKENLAFQRKGSEINAQLEKDVGPVQQVLRDYGPMAGYAAGLGGGYLGKKLINAGSNKMSANAAKEAEALFNDLPAGSGKGPMLDKATSVNQFWRGGGAGEAVPFTMTPTKAPGIAANEGVAATSGLYAPPKVRHNTVDTVTPLVGAGDAAYFQFSGIPHAEAELKAAYEAADKSPTDANLRRVQAAKDSVAIGEFMQNAGRAFAGTYTGKVFTSPRNPTQPSMKEAELTRGQVEEWLRAQTAKASAPSKPTPSAPSLPETAATPRTTRARASDPARYTPEEFRQPQAQLQAPPTMPLAPPSLPPAPAPLALPAPARSSDEVLQELLRRYGLGLPSRPTPP